MIVTIVIIKPQTGNGAEVWMTSCPDEMVLTFEDFKNCYLRLDHGGRELGMCHWGIESIFFTVAAAIKFFGSRLAEMNWDLGNGISIVRIVSLSSCRRTEVKKLINRSYLTNRVRLYMHLYLHCCDWYHSGDGYTTNKLLRNCFLSLLANHYIIQDTETM